MDLKTPLELDLFNPVYGTSPRPDFDTLPLISDRETETRRLRIFAQDRVSFTDNFFLLGGLRYDTVAALFYERNNWRVGLNFKNLFDVDYIAGASPVRERGNDRGEPFTVLGSLAIEF